MLIVEVRPEDVSLVAQGRNARVLMIDLGVALEGRILVPVLADPHDLLKVGDRLMIKHQNGWYEDGHVVKHQSGLVKVLPLGTTLAEFEAELQRYRNKIDDGACGGYV
jgi:hypothetical protein